MNDYDINERFRELCHIGLQLLLITTSLFIVDYFVLFYLFIFILFYFIIYNIINSILNSLIIYYKLNKTKI